jgi:hypothetical protein
VEERREWFYRRVSTGNRNRLGELKIQRTSRGRHSTKSYQINETIYQGSRSRRSRAALQITENELRFRLGRIERRSDLRNSIRTMRKGNPEHHDGVSRAASHSSPCVQAIRRLSGSGRTAQCAAGITIFFSNVLYPAVIVVLLNGEVNSHRVTKYFLRKKITRPMNSSL